MQPSLRHAEVQLRAVAQEVRQREELGGELFHVAHVGEDAGPRRGDRVEEAVGHVEAAALFGTYTG